MTAARRKRTTASTTRARRLSARPSRAVKNRKRIAPTVFARPEWIGRLVVIGGVVLLALALQLFFASPPSVADNYPELASWRQSVRACQQTGGLAEGGFCFPVTQSACESNSGQWLLLGGATGYGCNRVAPDAGRACSDNNQCSSGQCLGIVTIAVRQGLGTKSHNGVAADGVCAGYLRVFGCNALVHDGRVYELICRE